MRAHPFSFFPAVTRKVLSALICANISFIKLVINIGPGVVQWRQIDLMVDSEDF